MAVALARQLREGTKKSHTMAENTGFISCFLKGVVDKSSYRNLLADLYFVYSAMEEEIEKLCENSHPIISPIGFKELFRKEKLEQDLSFYFGSNWSELVKPSKPALEYEARIREIAKNNPELLIGHHYSRYIGDLSGGQLLKTITKKAMNLPGDDGLSFYIFEEIRDEKEFKINGRLIGKKYKPYIIAEMSANHNGSIDVAKALIDMAVSCAVDAVSALLDDDIIVLLAPLTES